MNHSIHFANLLERLNQAIMMVDQDDRILYVNPYGLGLLGYDESTFIGKRITTICHNEEAINTYMETKNKVFTGISAHCNLSIKNNTGKPVVIQAQAHPYQDRTEEIEGLTIHFSLTNKSKDFLMEKDQLHLQVTKLKEELKDFTYIISHDLKAPLRGIKTLAEWIIQDYEDAVDEDGKKQFYLLKNRVQLLHNQIEGILKYSRIGRMVNSYTLFNLSGLLDKIKAEITNPQQIQLNFSNTLPILYADEVRIYELFYYLIDNAINFNDKGATGWVNVSSVLKENEIHICVEDNGRGIEPKNFDRVFKIFQKMGNEKDKLGIGLTLAKKIVDCLDGNIWIESIPHEGTKIWIALPNSILASSKQTTELKLNELKD